MHLQCSIFSNDRFVDNLDRLCPVSSCASCDALLIWTLSFTVVKVVSLTEKRLLCKRRGLKCKSLEKSSLHSLDLMQSYLQKCHTSFEGEDIADIYFLGNSGFAISLDESVESLMTKNFIEHISPNKCSSFILTRNSETYCLTISLDFRSLLQRIVTEFLRMIRISSWWLFSLAITHDFHCVRQISVYLVDNFFAYSTIDVLCREPQIHENAFLFTSTSWIRYLRLNHCWMFSFTSSVSFSES